MLYKRVADCPGRASCLQRSIECRTYDKEFCSTMELLYARECECVPSLLQLMSKSSPSWASASHDGPSSALLRLTLLVEIRCHRRSRKLLPRAPARELLPSVKDRETKMMGRKAQTATPGRECNQASSSCCNSNSCLSFLQKSHCE